MAIIDKQLLLQKVEATVKPQISLEEVFDILEGLMIAQKESDPLLQAKLKGLEVKQELLFHSGKPFTSRETGRVLNMSRQAVDKRRDRNKLLGLSLAKRGYLYPAWQFENGNVLPGFELVLEALAEISPWGKLEFMLTGDLKLEGKTPLECLKAGQIDKVIEAAKTYGQQVAT